MEIKIKHMVCRHCMAAVESLLAAQGMGSIEVELGKASFALPDNMPEGEALRRIDKALSDNGFERISDPDEQLVDDVKHAIIHHLRDEQECKYNLSACIASHIGVSYDQASRVFSRLEGRTIERYHILQKVEYVKELLAYKDLGLAEIAFRTGYSSVAHLSRQFKDVTGMTPTQYVASGASRRIPLDMI